MRMAARYSHAWTSQFATTGDDNGARTLELVAAEWSETLAGITDIELREGFAVDARRGDHWPPSAPEFAAMCRGVPPLGAVKFQLRKFGATHSRFTRLVWTFVDSFALKRADARLADKLLGEAYEQARDHVMRALPMPIEPSGVLPCEPEPRTPAKPETVRKALDQMAVALGDMDPIAAAECAP